MIYVRSIRSSQPVGAGGGIAGTEEVEAFGVLTGESPAGANYPLPICKS
jgi:hypothetical protein